MQSWTGLPTWVLGQGWLPLSACTTVSSHDALAEGEPSNDRALPCVEWRKQGGENQEPQTLTLEPTRPRSCMYMWTGNYPL